MSSRLFNYLKNDLLVINYQQLRHGHKIRGKPPGVAKTLKQRLEGIIMFVNTSYNLQ